MIHSAKKPKSFETSHGRIKPIFNQQIKTYVVNGNTFYCAPISSGRGYIVIRKDIDSSIRAVSMGRNKWHFYINLKRVEIEPFKSGIERCTSIKQVATYLDALIELNREGTIL